ncbi:MAG: ABC transporter permease [Candidatus Heimdallarchaeota archaeon]|nr:ABC transporter permease [Candidatus Heimdallarchaeota archaeon]
MERIEIRSKFNFFKWLLLINVNAYLPFALFDLLWTLYPALIITCISIIGVFIQFLRTRDSVYTQPLKIIDLLAIMGKYIKINRKYILFSSLGLILSVSIFSASILITYTQYTQYEDNRYFDLSAGFELDFYNLDIDTYSVINNEGHNIRRFLQNYGYEYSSIQTQMIFNGQIAPSYYNLTYHPSQQTFARDFRTENYTDSMFTLLTLLEFHPESYDPSERILLLPERQAHSIVQTSDPEYPFTFRFDLYQKINSATENREYFYSNYSVSRVITYSSDEIYQFADTPFDEISTNDGIILLQPISDTEALVDTILEVMSLNAFNPKYYNSGNMISYSYRFYLLNYELTKEFINKLNSVRLQLHEEIQYYELIDYEDKIFSIFCPLGEMIDDLISNLLYLQTMGMIATLVLSIISLFLVYFTLSVLQNRKKRLVRTMISRGTETDQLRSMLLMEILSLAFFSSIIGMILSLLMAKIALGTTGFMEFESIGKETIIPIYWYYKVPLLSFIFTMNISYPMFDSLTKLQVDYDVVNEKQEPLWKRKNVDLLVVGISLLYWSIVIIYPFNGDSELRYVFWTVIGFYVLLIFLIFSPLVVSRFFHSFLKFFSSKLWSRKAGLSSMTMKVMTNYRFSISKLVALFIITSLLSIQVIILPVTMNNYTEEYTNYMVGADMFIENADLSDPDVRTMLHSEEIYSYAEIYRVGIQKNDPNGQYGEFYTILGISSSFYSTAFWKPAYGNLSSITQEVISGNVAIDENYLDKEDLEFGEFDLSLESNKYTLNLSTSFTDFPRLMVDFSSITGYEADGIEQSAFFVMSIDKAREIGNYEYKDLEVFVQQGLYLDINRGVDLIEFRKELYTQLNGLSISIPSDYESEFTSSANMNIIIYSSIHALLVFSIVATLIAFAFHVFLSIRDRHLEIGMYRAMGMVNKQLFRIFSQENLIILISGLFAGIVIAMISIFSLIYVFSGLSDNLFSNGPNIRLIIPWNLLLQYLSLLFMVNLIVSLVPPFSLTKQKVSNILRME